MECNKDEARRAMDIAEKKLSVNDYVGAKKFVNKAQNFHPKLDGLEQALMMIDVYITAGNKITGGEADWYGIFGVDPLADYETVKKQYKKLALLLHPDKNKLKGAEEAFKLVSEAWSLLSNKAKRISYDQKRKSKTVTQKPPNSSKPASTNGNQNAGVNPSGGTGSNKAAGGMQKPPKPRKPAFTNGNQNASISVDPKAKARNASVKPSGGARSGGMQRPATLPKPLSNNGKRNASVNPSVVARSTNKPAGGRQRLATPPNKPALASTAAATLASAATLPAAAALSSVNATATAPNASVVMPSFNNVSSHQQWSAHWNCSFTFSAHWNCSFSVTSSSSNTVNAVNQTQQCQKRGHEEMVGPNLVASAATNEVARPLKKPMITKTPNPTLAGRPSPRLVTARTSNSTLEAVRPSSRPVTTRTQNSTLEAVRPSSRPVTTTTQNSTLETRRTSPRLVTTTTQNSTLQARRTSPRLVTTTTQNSTLKARRTSPRLVTTRTPNSTDLHRD